MAGTDPLARELEELRRKLARTDDRDSEEIRRLGDEIRELARTLRARMREHAATYATPPRRRI